MILEEEIRNYKDNFYFEEPELLKQENVIDKIYEILEQHKIYDIFPTYHLQDDELAQNIFELSKTIFWGMTALASTLLWLYFFLT
jgi:hypothetical protein